MRKGDTIVKELVKELSVFPDITVTPSSTSRMQKVFQLDGRVEGLIYIKGIGAYPHRWGITENTVRAIESQGKPWCVILLHDSKDTGYVISSKEYHGRAKELWPWHQGDYKITDGKSLVNIPHFSSVEELLNLITSILHATFSVKSAIQKAIEETKTLRRQNGELHGGESPSHKKLKEYVASHPEVIGLKGEIKAHLEFAFPSGDQADIAFNLGSNNWIIIEIELEGFNQTFVGLFQAVKYRALQQAVLTTQQMEGQVEGFLIARTIPEDIQQLARLLHINVHEVRI